MAPEQQSPEDVGAYMEEISDRTTVIELSNGWGQPGNVFKKASTHFGLKLGG